MSSPDLQGNKTRKKSPKRQAQIAGDNMLKVSSYALSPTFFTQIKPKSIQQQQAQLVKYIQSLKKQIRNALWKQQLILQYSYMPLQTIKQKIQLEKQTYQNKINSFKKQYEKMFENSQFTEELTNLRLFNQKLKDKMKHYELKIQENKIKNKVLDTEAHSKRQRLKQMLKHNMELSKNYVENLGATNKQDLVKMVKAKSQRILKKRNPSQLSKLDLNKLELLKRSASAKLIKLSSGQSLFEQCLDKLTQSIKGMKSSDDIQSGIYLEIMDKNKDQFKGTNRLTHRSTISNTLHERYGPKIHKRNNKHFVENEFEIEWELFKDLNWKQILGIIMVKDPNCQKLKGIFKNPNLHQHK